ncbi:MBL fold metallo-hydrolase [Plantactinospora sp. WMMC1484]|uniref:MBL fold metallo-hydrolase n=1 Tax=Plantactinospora sp. WMMC1484 TaxID=3404122 RepID=UPI003BF48190
MSDRTSEYRIHTYTAAETGLFVNSYLVETTEGVVLVDANLLLSDVRALAARIAALHKPLLGVFVTHAHPDHSNGLCLRFASHVVGAAESHADSYLTLDDRAFIGDLAFHGTHPYTAELASEATGSVGTASAAEAVAV